MIESITNMLSWIMKAAWNNNEDICLIISLIGGIIFGLICAIITISEFKIEEDGIVTIICCFLFTSGFAGLIGASLTALYPITISLIIFAGIGKVLEIINDWSIEKAKHINDWSIEKAKQRKGDNNHV